MIEKERLLDICEELRLSAAHLAEESQLIFEKHNWRYWYPDNKEGRVPTVRDLTKTILGIIDSLEKGAHFVSNGRFIARIVEDEVSVSGSINLFCAGISSERYYSEEASAGSCAGYMTAEKARELTADACRKNVDRDTVRVLDLISEKARQGDSSVTCDTEYPVELAKRLTARGFRYSSGVNFSGKSAVHVFW